MIECSRLPLFNGNSVSFWLLEEVSLMLSSVLDTGVGSDSVSPLISVALVILQWVLLSTSGY